MAHTTTASGHTIEVTFVDTSDWLWSSVQSSPGSLLAITLCPKDGTTANERIKVRHGSITGPGPWLTSLDGEERTLCMYGVDFSPCIDYSECTITTGTSVIFTFSRNY